MAAAAWCGAVPFLSCPPTLAPPHYPPVGLSTHAHILYTHTNTNTRIARTSNIHKTTHSHKCILPAPLAAALTSVIPSPRLIACPAGQFSARGSRLAASKPSAADVHHHFPSLEKLTDNRYRPISAPSSSRVAGTDVQVLALAAPIWLLAT
ncbi:hypothetical protein COCSADRAFT_254520 [Bipolaris sorokiniana ND90Pr]|uniref:Uncharacterized protein n=1 Tax=Cochliobolus sativus (strain ND90Pr / ATCC 201652) TaxID=665912 RepID=M2RXM5_COCSN|nr:uncharacterized protein COCSADRAFT_254520 [Bipolaris sorokiniana ND90Pr]EMD59813.1 hypothetical protein COCSADRAFT_254520 [Bipolaris sorokiniana ND90Pr]